MIVVIALLSSVILTGVSQGEYMAEGTTIAMGGELEIKEFYFPCLFTRFEDILREPYQGTQELEGEVGYYAMIDLLESYEETRRFEVTAGGGIHLHLEHSLKGEVPVEGSYADQEDIPYEVRLLEGKGDIHITHSLSMDLIFYNRNHTLKGANIISQWDMRGKYSGTNAIFIEDGNDTLSISYHDVDLDLRSKRTVVLYIDFIEAMDIFNLRGEMGAVVQSQYSARIEGAYEGFLDIKGLPDSELNALLDHHGVTELPVRWEDKDTELKGEQLGVIDERYVTVDLIMESISLDEMELADGETYGVRSMDISLSIPEIDEFSTISGRWWYSDLHGTIVSAHMSCTYIDEELKKVTHEDSISMEPVEDAYARERMRHLKNIPPMTPLETLLRPPWAYVILIVLFSTALLVHMYKQKKKDRPRDAD